MINFKVFLNKSVRKYGLILFVLFILIIICWNFNLCIDNQIKNESNMELYRSVSFVSKNKWNVEKSIEKYKDQIEEYEESENDYYLKFFDMTQLENFIEENKGNFSSISIASFSLDSKYGSIRTISDVLIILIVVSSIILILIFSVNIIYNLEKDIALYKLLGFKNKKIILYTLSFIYLYYFAMYLLAVLLMPIIFLVLKYFMINNILGIENVNLLTYKTYLLIWGIITQAIIISFIRIIYRIKKTSAINLIKS